MRHLTEPGKEVYRICADKWYKLYQLVIASFNMPVDGKMRSKQVLRWLSYAGIAIGTDVCFLADNSQTRCDSKHHTDG